MPNTFESFSEHIIRSFRSQVRQRLKEAAEEILAEVSTEVLARVKLRMREELPNRQLVVEIVIEPQKPGPPLSETPSR